MNRYLLSFFITLVVYSSLFLGFFYVDFDKQKITIEKIDNKVSFQIIKKPKLEIKIKPTFKKNVIKKVKKKKIIKKKKVTKKKKKLRKKVNLKEKTFKKTVKKPTISKNKIFKIEPEKIANKEINKKVVKSLQNKFLIKLKLQIDKNKYYPRVAKRRNIEGYVKISFTILKNGNINNIRLDGNKKYFETSVQKALQKSFPISTINSGFSFPLKMKFKINFQLF